MRNVDWGNGVFTYQGRTYEIKDDLDAESGRFRARSFISENLTITEVGTPEGCRPCQGQVASAAFRGDYEGVQQGNYFVKESGGKEVIRVEVFSTIQDDENLTTYSEASVEFDDILFPNHQDSTGFIG